MKEGVIKEATYLLRRSGKEMAAATELINVLGAENQRLHERNKRYSAALREILANSEPVEGLPEGHYEPGNVARKALEG